MGKGMDSVRIIHTAGKTHVALGAKLGIADVRLLHEKLSAILIDKTPVMVDGGEVARLDTAALQLLAGFCRTARERGLVLTWEKISPDLRQATQLLGLESIFG